jgi:hypothetical protein
MWPVSSRVNKPGTGLPAPDTVNRCAARRLYDSRYAVLSPSSIRFIFDNPCVMITCDWRI